MTEQDYKLTRRVLVESPFAGKTTQDRIRNLEYLHKCCIDCLDRNESPYASHGFFTYFLDDRIPEQRKLGMEAGFLWGEAADLVVVYADYGISEGMAAGIARATLNKTPIVYRKILGKRYEEAQKPSGKIIDFEAAQAKSRASEKEERENEA